MSSMPGAGDNGHETVHIPPPVKTTEPKKSLSTKLFDFIEHPLTLTALFGLGGLVGTLIYTPFYVLCALCLLLGLHRSGLVSAQPPKVQIFIHIEAIVILCVGGYFLYGALDAAVERIQTDFAKKVAAIVKQNPASSQSPSSETKPTDNPPTEAKTPPKKGSRSIKDPLEIIAFNSGQDISVANNGSVSVYAIRLLVNEGNFSKSFGLNSEIGPGKTKTIPIGDGFLNVRTLRGLADTWSEHLKKAGSEYSNCWQFTFFSQSDARLFQIRDHYISQGKSFVYDKEVGTIYYRLDGVQGTREEKVPIAVTVTLNADICPGP